MLQEKKKDDEYEKKILLFWSTVALLTFAPSTALPHNSLSRESDRSASRHCPESLPLLGELLILDNVHVGFSFKIVQCNNCFQVTIFFSFFFFFFFFQLVPSLYQNTFRIESKRTILTLSICYRVYIVLTLKPDWLLFNILLSNIKILSFFLKDGIQ